MTVPQFGIMRIHCNGQSTIRNVLVSNSHPSTFSRKKRKRSNFPNSFFAVMARSRAWKLTTTVIQVINYYLFVLVTTELLRNNQHVLCWQLCSLCRITCPRKKYRPFLEEAWKASISWSSSIYIGGKTLIAEVNTQLDIERNNDWSDYVATIQFRNVFLSAQICWWTSFSSLQ